MVALGASQPLGAARCGLADECIMRVTDLFLAFTGHDCGFPVIDCADVHVDAIYKKSAA